MNTFNTDYNNTELLDQELTAAELSEVSGGVPHHMGYQLEEIKRVMRAEAAKKLAKYNSQGGLKREGKGYVVDYH